MALLYTSLRKSSWFQSSSNQLILLIKAMCLANTTKFFLLPIVIWRAQQSDFVIQLNFMIVIGYFVYGLVNVHSGWFFLRCEKMKIESKNSLLVCVTNFVLRISVISAYDRIYAGFAVISSLAIKSIMFSIIIRHLERNFFPFLSIK